MSPESTMTETALKDEEYDARRRVVAIYTLRRQNTIADILQ